MRKILHVISGLYGGGAEGVLCRLCCHDKKNIHVVVSMMDEGRFGPVLRRSGITVFCLNMPRGGISLRGLFRLWGIMRAERPNVLQTWMYHADLLGGILGRIAGIEDIYWNVRHAELDPKITSWSTLLVAKTCALISSFIPRKIIICGEHARKVHKSIGYDDSRMTVISNGYDLSSYSFNSDARIRHRNALNIGFDDIVIGSVGRFHPQKDHETFLLAASLLVERGYSFKIVLIGEGMDSQGNGLDELIRANRLGNIVRCLGPRNDVNELMCLFDIHVLSSVSGEGFPNVLGEAMACSIPCVSTNVGDSALIIGETGWIVPTQDPESLSKALESAIGEMSNEVIWSERKLAARNRIEINFSLDIMVERYHLTWLASQHCN